MIFLCYVVLLLSLSRTASSLDEKNRSSSVEEIRASAFHYPPFFIVSEEKNGSSPIYTGYCFDIVNWISDVLRISISYVPVNKTEIRNSGITQAIINQLLRKEVDIIPMTLFQTPERNRRMDFTTPILIGKNRMLLRYPEEESRLSAITRPFSLLTWGVIAVIILSLTATIIAVNVFYGGDIRSACSVKCETLSRSILVVLNMGLGQDMGTSIYKRLKKRSTVSVAAAFWCLSAVVICNAYTGTLTSFLTLPKLKPIINSLEELAASNRYKLTAELNSAFTDTFLRATSGYYKILGDSLRQNPQLLFSDYQQGTKNVLTKQAVFLRGSVDILTRISQDMIENKDKCRLTASKETGDPSFLSFGLSKDHPSKEIINKKLSTLWESGLLSYWFRQYTPNIDKCLVTSNNEAKLQKKPVRSFNLSDTSGIFLVLGTGLIISWLIFLVEFIFFYLFKT